MSLQDIYNNIKFVVFFFLILFFNTRNIVRELARNNKTLHSSVFYYKFHWTDNLQICFNTYYIGVVAGFYYEFL